MNFKNLKQEIKNKIMNGVLLTDLDKGIKNNAIIADYSILVKYTNGVRDITFVGDCDGDLQKLLEKKTELENKFPNCQFMVEKISRRKEIYEEAVAEIQSKINYDKKEGLRKLEELRKLMRENKLEELKKRSKEMLIQNHKTYQKNFKKQRTETNEMVQELQDIIGGFLVE
jgi:uncharacterized Rossmann fold enzyme